MIKITCSNCGKKLEAPDEAAGKKGKCTGCGEVFDVPDKNRSEDTPLDSEKEISKRDLKKCPYCAEEIQKDAVVCRYCRGNLSEEETNSKDIKLRCAKCGNRFTLPLEVAGKEGKCPSCDMIFDVPKANDLDNSSRKDKGTSDSEQASDKESDDIKLRCAKCGNRFYLPQTSAGKEGVCPNCKMVFDVPRVDGMDGEDAEGESGKLSHVPEEKGLTNNRGANKDTKINGRIVVFLLFLSLICVMVVSSLTERERAKTRSAQEALFKSVRTGDATDVKLSLQRGADVNAKDRFGLTPLHWAATDGRTEIAKLLLNKGADVSARDRDRFTPLHWAATYGHTEIARNLLDRGADVNATAGRFTPLYLATTRGHTATVRLLRQRGGRK